MRPLPFLLCAGLTVVLLATPPVSAQTTQPIVEVVARFAGLGEDGLLHPETEKATGSVTARVIVGPGGVCASSLDVLFRVQVLPSYASVVLMEPFQSISVWPSINPATYVVETPVAVWVSRDAPAFGDGTYRFVVEVRSPALSQGCTVGSGVGAAQTIIKNDYVPGIRLGDATTEYEGLSGWIDVPIENLANGPTRVVPSFQETPSPFVLLNAQAVVLESPATTGSGAASRGTMRISYILDNVETASLKVRLAASHDLSPSSTEQVVVEYVAVGRLPPAGEAAEPAGALDEEALAALPGPDVALLMLVGGALLAWSRRRVG